MRQSVLILILSVVLSASSSLAAERQKPEPLPGHPGNVFLQSEQVTVAVPAGVVRVRVADVDDKAAYEGPVEATPGRVNLGRLPIGWYQVQFSGENDKAVSRTTLAVLADPVGPTPADSPVCVDAATAWFARHYPGEEAEHQRAFANLAALAGVNWIRDRMSWGELETQSGHFAEQTQYDSSASLQTEQGLSVLQVFHSTPAWATDKTLDGPGARRRFPRDLRAQYAFCKAMAKRFHGRVLAWEPWNEANITVFGGHTIDEMCSLQKAAYLGFKAGDSDVTVCWNVYAGSGSTLHTEGVLANEAWPYFETYNIHSYSRPEDYPRQFDTARQAACGRPMWITECGIRLPAENAAPWGDLSPDNERRQAQFIARSYATSLYSGVDRHFFFILGNYIERGVQFGLLRHDLTPRRGYVALAAVGRFLSQARSLGRLSPTAYAFRAQPDGKPRDVLVTWSDMQLPTGLEPIEVFDCWGRSLGKQMPAGPSESVVFVILPVASLSHTVMEQRLKPSPTRLGAASSIVLQASFPEKATRLDSQAHAVEPGQPLDLPLFGYNFSDQPVRGTVGVTDAPSDWQVDVSSEPFVLNPMERRRIQATVTLPSGGRTLIDGAWIHLHGEFGDAGRPALAFRLAADLKSLHPSKVQSIRSADRAENWQDNIMAGATMSHRASGQGETLFEMHFGDSDPWAYPRLILAPDEVPDNSMDGLELTVQLLEGIGTVRVQFIEENGAAYVADVDVDANDRSPQRALIRFRHGRWGSFSQHDPDGKLQPSNIRTILVGINSEKQSTVRMAVRELKWFKF